MLKIYNKPLSAQLFLIFFIGGLSIIAANFFGELLPKNNGLGWDGGNYVALVKNFDKNITVINDNSIKRFFPSFLLYSVFKFFNISASLPNIILAFQFYNWLLLLVLVFIWQKISQAYNFSVHTNWLGFSGLFLSFAIIKFAFYYPTLTDTSAFFISLILIYFYKKRNWWAVMLCMLLGAITWPTITYSCLVLMFFKPTSITLNESKLWDRFLPIIVAGLFIACAAFLIYRYPQSRGFSSGTMTYIIRNMVPISLMVTFSFLFFSMRSFLKGVPVFRIRELVSSINIRNATFGFLLFIFFEILYKFYSKMYHLPHVSSIGTYIWNIVVTGSRQPACFIISHIFYFGPILILTILFWKQICEIIKNEGWGLYFVFAQFLFFSLDAESRHLMSYVPFVIVFTLCAVNEKLNLRNTLAMIFLSFLFSRIWISQKKFPTNDWSFNYFMNFGQFYTDKTYLINLFLIIITTGIVYYFFRTKQLKNI